MDATKPYHHWAYGKHQRKCQSCNDKKMLPKIWAKHGLKMMKKLCNIAAVSSEIGKIHLSKVKKLSVFHHKSRHHQQFKKIW